MGAAERAVEEGCGRGRCRGQRTGQLEGWKRRGLAAQRRCERAVGAWEERLEGGGERAVAQGGSGQRNGQLDGGVEEEGIASTAEMRGERCGGTGLMRLQACIMIENMKAACPRAPRPAQSHTQNPTHQP